MVGHSKFCLLLLGGSLLFHETLAINQVIGITLTLMGVILYAHVKVNTIFAQYLFISTLHLIQNTYNFPFQMRDNQTIVPEFEDRETKPLYKV